MNDLPITAIPPNVSHLQRSDDGAAVDANSHVLSANDFSFSVVPFATLHDIPITFALESKLNADDVRRRVNECGLLAPTTKWDENENISDDPPFMDRTENCNAHVQSIRSFLTFAC